MIKKSLLGWVAGRGADSARINSLKGIQRKYSTNGQENSDVDLICVTGKADTVPGWLKALDLDQYESSMMANGFDDINFLVGLRLVISLNSAVQGFLCL